MGEGFATTVMWTDWLRPSIEMATRSHVPPGSSPMSVPVTAKSLRGKSSAREASQIQGGIGVCRREVAHALVGARPSRKCALEGAVLSCLLRHDRIEIAEGFLNASAGCAQPFLRRGELYVRA